MGEEDDWKEEDDEKEGWVEEVYEEVEEEEKDKRRWTGGRRRRGGGIGEGGVRSGEAKGRGDEGEEERGSVGRQGVEGERRGRSGVGDQVGGEKERGGGDGESCMTSVSFCSLLCCATAAAEEIHAWLLISFTDNSLSHYLSLSLSLSLCFSLERRTPRCFACAQQQQSTTTRRPPCVPAGRPRMQMLCSAYDGPRIPPHYSRANYSLINVINIH